MFFKKLYVRTWLSVVLAVAVLTLLVVWAWGLAAEPRGHFGNGPEFVVRMQDGQTVHMHMPRPPPSAWYRPPFGFFWSLVLVAVAMALATYPIIRKLKQRLEPLQNGVQK